MNPLEERDQILRERFRDNLVSISRFVIGLFFLAGAAYAKSKGNVTWWSLLVPAFGLLLRSRPDRKQQRLDELNRMLYREGRLPRYFWSSILLSLFFPLAPIALILAISGLGDTMSRGGRNKAVSIFCITWAAIFTLVLLLVVVTLIVSPPS
jgi:hypothetical protein